MRRILFVAVGAVVLATAFAAPASAADTTTTFTVTTGTLTITAPASAALGSGAPGGLIDSSLGNVTVVDERGVAPAPWAATVYGTDFTNGTVTIPIGSVSYWSGAATATTGDGTFTPGQITSADEVALGGIGTPLTAFSHTGGTGGNSATWSPGLEVAVPATAQVGVYTGTVTHSVA